MGPLLYWTLFAIGCIGLLCAGFVFGRWRR